MRQWRRVRPTSKWRADRVPSAFIAVHRQLIFEQAAQHRLPAVYGFRYFAADGGLMSYGIDVRDLFRRSAACVGGIPQLHDQTRRPDVDVRKGSFADLLPQGSPHRLSSDRVEQIPVADKENPSRRGRRAL